MLKKKDWPIQNSHKSDKTYLHAGLTIYASGTHKGPHEVEETPQSGLSRRQDAVVSAPVLRADGADSPDLLLLLFSLHYDSHLLQSSLTLNTKGCVNIREEKVPFIPGQFCFD